MVRSVPSRCLNQYWNIGPLGTNFTGISEILLIGPLGANFSGILIEIPTFSFKKIHLKMSYAKWLLLCVGLNVLTHWGRVTHICVSKLTVIASDNGLSPGRRQAIVWTNAGKLLIKLLGTNFRETIIEIHTFSSKKMHLKMSSGKWRPFFLGLNVLTIHPGKYAHGWCFVACRCG